MGYRGKLAEREQAHRLRATGLALIDIATILGVSKSSVSLWVRDVAFESGPRVDRGRRRAPNALQRRKRAEIDRLLAEGRDRARPAIGARVPGRGGRAVRGGGQQDRRRRALRQQRPTHDRVLLLLAAPFLRDRRGPPAVHLYLHQGLDLATAVAYWSAVTRIPPAQFLRPYRAAPDPSIRRAKHVHGCVGVGYSCCATHRCIMGLVAALLGDTAIPG
jgi:hypothetical protein